MHPVIHRHRLVLLTIPGQKVLGQPVLELVIIHLQLQLQPKHVLSSVLIHVPAQQLLILLARHLAVLQPHKLADQVLYVLLSGL